MTLWTCPACRAALDDQPAALACPACGTSYPRVSGVPVLVRQPLAYLRHSAELLRHACRRADERPARLRERWAEEHRPLAALRRLERVARAERDTLAALATRLAPVDTLLDDAVRAGAPVDLGDFGLGDPGWRAGSLLPYLVRDWCCDRELAAVEELVGDAVARHLARPRREATLLMPGLGAGGLLRRLAPGFASVVGVELSLPIVLALQALLHGDDLRVWFPVESGAGVEVRELVLEAARARGLGRVELVAADACQLPLADGGADVVVTRFLLDVVHDPGRLAEEIRRVLAPGGVWVNYGPASALDGPWHFDPSESAAFLEVAGFEVTEQRSHRNTHLDHRDVDPSSRFEDHVCHLFVARPTASRRASAPAAPRSGAEGGAIAEVVPRHHLGAELVFRERLGADGGDGGRLFLEQETVRGHGLRFEIGEGLAAALRLVDGRRTVREIVSTLRRDEPDLDEHDAFDAFRTFLVAGLLRGGKAA